MHQIFLALLNGRFATGSGRWPLQQVYEYVTFLRHFGASATSADSFVKAMKFFMHHTRAYLKSPISARVSGGGFLDGTQEAAVVASATPSDDACPGLKRVYGRHGRPCSGRRRWVFAVLHVLFFAVLGCCQSKHHEATGIANHACLMRALAPSASWLQRPMTAGEGSMWLRELLHLTSVSGDLEAFTSHSLKATALSWSAKSGTMTYEERLTQGHHVHPKLGMALLYSRDAMAEIMVKVGRIIRAIVSGGFSPDRGRRGLHLLCNELLKISLTCRKRSRTSSRVRMRLVSPRASAQTFRIQSCSKGCRC